MSASKKSVPKRLSDWKQQTFTKEKMKGFFTDFIVLLIGCCISSFSVQGVMIPNGLTSGGVTGIIRMIQNFVDVNFSSLYWVASVVVLALVAIFMGLKELRKIIFLAIMYPLVLTVFEMLPIELLETKDVMLAAIFCGVFNGIWIGLIFWRGYASAGMDAIAKIIRKKFFPTVTPSKILLAIEVIIIGSSALVFDRNIALYALITQVITTKVSEMVMFGFESKIVQLTILTVGREEIIDYITNELHRGVTSTEVRGEYTNRDMRQLILLCSPRESVLIRKKLAKIDPHAFITMTKVETVWGGTGKGFSDIDEQA